MERPGEEVLAAWTARAGSSPESALAWAREEFGRGRVALASSLGVEDQVLTALWVAGDSGARVFTLDTGRLPSETYDTLAATRANLGVSFEVYFPDAGEVEGMVRRLGVNLFYDSVENRRLCCAVRKVHPLRRALQGLSAWITGLRAEQSPGRSGVETVEWDAEHGLVKLNPLARWTTEQVWARARELGVPLHPLHEKGYPSIGCAPCTRAVAPGEDLRAGRWWWERSEHKECGLHRPQK